MALAGHPEASAVSGEHRLCYAATLVNFLNAMIGPGTLSVPIVFKQAGLMAGLVMMFLFAFLNNYCMLQLTRCSQHITRVHSDDGLLRQLDYGQVAYYACAHSFPAVRRFKRLAQLAVNMAICGLQMGICSVSIVFMAVHMKQITAELFQWQASEVDWMWILLPPLIALNLTRTMRVIFYVCSVGNVFMCFALAFILYYLLFRSSHHALNALPWITDFNGLATASGSAMYTFEGQAVVLPLENKLRHPELMLGPFGVLSSGMSTVSLVYALVGSTGYITYGAEVKGSISLNLPTHMPLFVALDAVLVLVVYFGYPLQQYVVVEMLLPHVKQSVERRKGNKRYYLLLEIALRASLVLVATLLAVLVPNLEDIIPLVGITSGMMLAFIFPATLDTLTFLPVMIDAGVSKWKVYCRLTQNCLLMLLGVFGLVVGLQANIRNLVRSE